MSLGDSSVGPELHIPAEAGFVRYARLLGAAIGDAADFDVDQIDDLRIGIDEACVVLIEQAEPTGPLELGFRVLDDGVVVEGACDAGANGDTIGPRPDDLQAQILAAVVDEIRFELGSGRASFRLRKRR